MASIAGLAKRAGWNIVDQALSALGNMLLMVVVARSVDADAFGAFAIGFLVYGVSVAVGKAVVGQPLTILHSADSPRDFRSAVAKGLGVTIWLGIAFGLLCALVALLLSGSLRYVLLAVAVCLPLLMVQDNQRMAFFAKGRSDHATLIDFVKVVAQFGLLFALLAAGVEEVGLLTLSWGVAAVISSLVGMWLLGCAPQLRGCWAWVARQRKLTKYLLAEYSLGLGAAQLGSMLVPVLGTARDAGAIRGGQTLLGPLNVLWTAALAFAVPEISRRRRMSPQMRIKAMALVSGAMTFTAVCYVTLLWLLPDAIGVELFGDTWAGAQTVLVALGINSIASALGSGPGAMMLGMGLAKKTYRLNLVKAPILLGLLVPGTMLYGATGAAWAMAISEAVLLPFWTYTAVAGARGRYNHEIEHLNQDAPVVDAVDRDGAQPNLAEPNLAEPGLARPEGAEPDPADGPAGDAADPSGGSVRDGDGPPRGIR